MKTRSIKTILIALAYIGWVAATALARGEDLVQRELQELRQANAALLGQFREQQAVISKLASQIDELQRSRQLADIKSGDNVPTAHLGGVDLGGIHLSGEAGMGFFHTGREGAFPNSEFRLDEAKLFAEAQVFENVFAFGEINLATGSDSTLGLHLGELYVDFEDVSQLWKQERILNLRLGRMDIPYGEEYLQRDAIDNALISHSLSDFWGVDEGVELYGAIGHFSYALAVQNGGNDGLRDFNGDKSIAGRLAYDATSWLRLSVSGMRTGDLAAGNNQDFLSAQWFGGGFFRSIGSSATTRFHVNMVQGDAIVRWKQGRLHAFGGMVRYDDNDPAADNGRCIYHYSIEAQQNLTRKFYAAARYSRILAGKGYPLVGNGEFGDYFFGTNTKELWRLSLGLGCRLSNRVVLKAEYSFEQGTEITGEKRDKEDMLAVEAAVRF